MTKPTCIEPTHLCRERLLGMMSCKLNHETGDAPFFKSLSGECSAPSIHFTSSITARKGSESHDQDFRGADMTSRPAEKTMATFSALPDNETISLKPEHSRIGQGLGEESEGSPILAAIPLPTDEIEIEGKEEWYSLRMSWSGKIYDLKVGANDM